MSSKDPADVIAHIMEVLDRAMPLAGYKVMDGDGDSVIIRHSESDTDFEIKVSTLF